MPGIGAPESANNPYANIKMAKPTGLSNGSENVGDKLNKLSGNEMRSGVKYVDGNTHNKMDKDSFLKLLTVQLSNQDPLDPVDQKKMSADLAQFSSLEQLTNMNTKLDSLKQNAPAEYKFYGASFLGKKVTTSGSSIDYKGNGRAELSFKLPKNAETGIVRIYDSKNQEVAHMQIKKLPAGEHRLGWDGTMNDGTQASKGIYSYKVFGADETMAKFEGETKAEGVVTGTYFEDNQTVLVIDGQRRIFLHDVESFKLPEDNKMKQPKEETNLAAVSPQVKQGEGN